jgi:hypothetical protein
MNLLDSASHMSCNLIDMASSLQPEDSQDCQRAEDTVAIHTGATMMMTPSSLLVASADVRLYFHKVST